MSGEQPVEEKMEGRQPARGKKEKKKKEERIVC